MNQEEREVSHSPHREVKINWTKRVTDLLQNKSGYVDAKDGHG